MSANVWVYLASRVTPLSSNTDSAANIFPIASDNAVNSFVDSISSPFLIDSSIVMFISIDDISLLSVSYTTISRIPVPATANI